MDSALTTIGLPVALAIIMFGLGLDLGLDDFKRVGRNPKAAVIALACQLVLLPAICFGLVLALDLPPLLGIGMMLLASSPGGTTAALFSHLFRGDVALNISLTAINTVVAIVTLPLITGFAINHYGKDVDVSLPFGELVNVFALILIPVGLGMLVKAKAPGFAARMDKTVRIASAVILAILILGVILSERDNIGEYIADIGVAAALFCAVSLVIGYVVPKAFGVPGPQAIASSMEIGVHNSTLAIVVAVEVMDSVEMSIPAAVYSIIMFIFAAGWGKWVSSRETQRVSATVDA
ncbi:MAG: bile acid:sodium symporter family protein [Nocardioides sp.]|uniref:bile acid:sodium symporter family protein n=1 Tax=Nocardioides sp. TaxID=35761 RepID=UPI003EFCA8AA